MQLLYRFYIFGSIFILSYRRSVFLSTPAFVCACIWSGIWLVQTCSCIFLLLCSGKTPLHQCKFIYIYILQVYSKQYSFFPYLLPFPSTQTLILPRLHAHASLPSAHPAMCAYIPTSLPARHLQIAGSAAAMQLLRCNAQDEAIVSGSGGGGYFTSLLEVVRPMTQMSHPLCHRVTQQPSTQRSAV